jgi:hypothetical protein
MKLGHLTRSQRCIAPRCLKTLADTPLKFCTGCGGALYCSRSCQKRAWNDADVGHRALCSDILLINEALSNGAGVLNAGRVAFAAHADGEAYARPILDNLERLSLMKLQAVNPGI